MPNAPPPPSSSPGMPATTLEPPSHSPLDGIALRHHHPLPLRSAWLSACSFLSYFMLDGVSLSSLSLSPHGARLGHVVAGHREPSTAIERHCAAPPLHRRVVVSGESTPRLLAQRLVLLTVTLPPKTLPCLDLCSDGAGCTKAPPRAWPLRGDHGAERVTRAAGHRVGRPPRWAEPRQQAGAPPLHRPPRSKDRGHGLDSAYAPFKPFLFPFYLNKFQKLFQTLKFERN
jgi:hypothetical protein